MFEIYYKHLVKVKVKVTLEQATKAQRGEQMYNSILPSTSALDGGGWSAPSPGRFTPRERNPVLVVQEAGWTPTGPVRNISPPPGFAPLIVQPVASRYTD
jgi:hypothetical protein